MIRAPEEWAEITARAAQYAACVADLWLACDQVRWVLESAADVPPGECSRIQARTLATALGWMAHCQRELHLATNARAILARLAPRI